MSTGSVVVDADGSTLQGRFWEGLWAEDGSKETAGLVMRAWRSWARICRGNKQVGCQNAQ